ncbi:MAG: hypothetical protein Q8Q11_00740 [bacterium]|nr:hypothetical protein [bacterium]
MTTVIISYLVYLVIIGGFAVAGVYHTRRFGFPGDKTQVAAGLYLFTVVAIVIATFVTIGGIEVTGGG